MFGLFSALALMIYAIPEIYISLFEPYHVDSTFIFCIVDIGLASYVLSKLMSVNVCKADESSMDQI